MADSNKRKQYAAPALSKGLDILEMMTSEPDGLSLKDMAGKLNRSKGEIFRMLVVLEERGYVTLDTDSDVYTLTLKIFELAHQHSHVKRLTSVAIPIMRKLARDTQQSCHLVIYFNGYGIVVVQQDSPTERGFGVRLGAHAPLPNTCSGHVLMAYSEPWKLKEMLSEQPAKYKKLLSKRARTEIVNRVQEQGFEEIKSQQVQGVIDIGYPVFDFSGKIIAALVIPFLEHLDGSHWVDLGGTKHHLRLAGNTVSQGLGYKGLDS